MTGDHTAQVGLEQAMQTGITLNLILLFSEVGHRSPSMLATAIIIRADVTNCAGHRDGNVV